MLDEHAITHVVHLAALQVPFCRADPPLGARVNVVGTVNVFEAVARRRERIAGPVVYASSVAAYDALDEGEDHTAMEGVPSTLYGVYKRANEGTASVYAAEQDVRERRAAAAHRLRAGARPGAHVGADGGDAPRRGGAGVHDPVRRPVPDAVRAGRGGRVRRGGAAGRRRGGRGARGPRRAVGGDGGRDRGDPGGRAGCGDRLRRRRRSRSRRRRARARRRRRSRPASPMRSRASARCSSAASSRSDRAHGSTRRSAGAARPPTEPIHGP